MVKMERTLRLSFTLTPSSVQHTLYLCMEMSLFQLIFHLRRPLTADAFHAFYVNKYIDHHAFEIAF